MILFDETKKVLYPLEFKWVSTLKLNFLRSLSSDGLSSTLGCKINPTDLTVVCWDLPNYILNVYYVFHFVYRLYSLNASFVSFTRLHSFTPHCSFTPLRISVGIIRCVSSILLTLRFTPLRISVGIIQVFITHIRYCSFTPLRISVGIIPQT